MSSWLIEPRVESTLVRLEPVNRWSKLEVTERDNTTGTWSVTGQRTDLTLLALADRGVVISRDGVPVMSGEVDTIDLTSSVTTVTGTSDFAVFDARNVFPNPGSSWAAQTANGYDVQTGLAETVLLHYVTVNAGSSAYAGSGTYSDRRQSMLVVPTTAGRGPTIRWTGRFGKLSGVVARIGEKADLHLDVIHDESSGRRRLVTVRAGVDRRGEIRFGTPDQLANGVINDDWHATIIRPGITDALVAGGGVLTARTSGYAHDTAAISLWGGHVREQVIDQRNTTDQAELDDSAADALADNNAPLAVDFTVTSLDPSLTFDPGDTVGVNFYGIDLTAKVRERTTTVEIGSDTTETVQVVVGSRDASARVTTTQKKLLDALRRIESLEAQ